MNAQFKVIGLDYSPIKGPEGNIEYLLYLRKGDDDVALDMEELRERIKLVTDNASDSLTLV